MKGRSAWSPAYQFLLDSLEDASDSRKLATFELVFFGSRIVFSALVAFLQAQLERVVQFPMLLPLPSSFLGLLLVGVGEVIAIASIWTFLKIGRGTPAYVMPPKELVSTGPYSYVRNPMYVGIFVTSVGFAFLFDASLLLVAAFILTVVIHFEVVLPEERRLEARFGGEYVDYKKRVPRWIPRIRSAGKESGKL
jgi:protein-S-isoprenylcysteine O-methyltransferase Ste14